MKSLLIQLLILISGICGVNAQTNNNILCQSRIDEINSMPLVKIAESYDRNAGAYWKTVDNLEDNNIYDGYYKHIYLDHNHNIRKLIYYSSSEDHFNRLICYYDINGNLLFMILKISEVSTVDIYGSMHYLDSEIIKIDIIKTEYKDGMPLPQTKIGLHNLNNEVGSFNMDDFTNTKSLSDFLNLDIQKLDFTNAFIFQFSAAEKNKYTTVNTNSLNVRQDTSVKSQIQGSLNAGDTAYILDMINLPLEDKSLNYWYKIRYDTENGNKEGYVFGAFLEPVEKIIKP